MRFSRFAFLSLALVSGAALFCATGCGHGPGGRRGGGDPMMTMVELEGKGEYFKGQVKASVRLVRADVPLRGPKGGGGGTGGGGGKRGMGGGPGGGMGGGPGGGMGGGPGGGMGGGPGGAPDSGGAPSEVATARISEGQGPTMIFRIALENTGEKPLTVAVWEFNSVLGNFAVRPERLELHPGIAAEFNPMSTRLGGGGDGFPVTLTLRSALGEEKQIIVLHEDRGDEGRPPAPAQR